MVRNRGGVDFDTHAQQVTITDGAAEGMAVGTAPVAQLAVIVDEAKTAAEALKISRTDWTVKQAPAEFTPEGTSKRIKTPNYFVNYRADTHRCLGVVKQRYKPVQNREAFAFLDGLVAEGGLLYDKVLSLRGGRDVILLARFPEEYKIRTDPHRDYILFKNSFKENTAMWIALTSTNLWCLNQLPYALTTLGGERLRLIHDGSLEEKMSEARRIFGMADTFRREVRARLNLLANTSFSWDAMDFSLSRLFPLPEGADPNVPGGAVGRVLNIRERVKALWGAAPNNTKACVGTAFGALQAVTYYADHEYQVRSKDPQVVAERRAEHSILGNTAVLKRLAVEVISEVAGVTEPKKGKVR